MFDEKAGKIITAPLANPRLKPGSIPSQFPDGPSYLTTLPSTSTRESPNKKRARLEMEGVEHALQASLKEKEDYDSKNKFHNLVELKSCLERQPLGAYWTVLHTDSRIMCANFVYEPSPKINISVLIDSDCKVSAHVKNVPLLSLKNIYFPQSINNTNDLLSILNTLESTFSQPENDDSENDKAVNAVGILNDMLAMAKSLIPSRESEINFLVEQVRNLNSDKQHHRYSPEFMIFCSLLHSISPHSYKFLRNSGNVIIPHPHTLDRLCSKFDFDPANEQLDEHFLSYIKQKISVLEEKEKLVCLMIDEVHLKPYFDFKGGNLCGAAYNSENAATSAFVFMIHSLLSKFKDVVHILPVKTLSANDFYCFLRKLVIGLESLGLRVIAVVTDNNAINKKAMSYFSTPPRVSIVYQNPADPSRPLFFIIDSVHILKCIRNNWLNQKNDGQCMFYPNFENMTLVEAASFAVIRKLHEVESCKLVKYGYGLTLKALFPTNLERQNVKLALQVFDTRVAEALMIVGKENSMLNYKTTSEYLKLICKWWYVVNVKTVWKGVHKNDDFQKPMTAQENDIKFDFLYRFLDWLDEWKKLNCSTGGLTKETHFALSHTTHALLEMAKYCIEDLKFSYFLPGKIQTDLLESRFGKYRQLAGRQHNVSIRQIYETESKLRLQSFLPCMVKSAEFGSIPIHFGIVDNEETETEVSESILQKFSHGITVSEEDVNGVKQEMPLLTYIAGYCCYSILKKLNCESCKGSLTVDKQLLVDEDAYAWIKVFDRGLLYPHPDVLNAVVYCFVVVQKIVSKEFEKEFLSSANQRAIVCSLTVNVLRENVFFLDLEGCEKSHEPEKILKNIIRASVNIFLNNYCKKKNDNFLSAKNAARRKLKTLDS